MDKVKEIETAVGKPVEQWNVSDLEKLTSEENLDLFQYFKESEVISECIERSKSNSEVLDILMPLYIKAKLMDAEKLGNDLLKQESEQTITTEELKDAVLKQLINTNSFYRNIVGYIILINKFEDFDLSTDEHRERVTNVINELKERIITLVNLDVMSCMELILDMTDLLFPLRQKYFDKYEVDVLDDTDGDLKKALDIITNIQQRIQEELAKILKASQETPEEQTGDEN